MTEIPIPTPADDDEFWGGIWWVPDGTGVRSATLGECATEIKRLRAIPAFLKALDGYPGAVIERLDALGPKARVCWVPDQRRTILISECHFTADQLRQMADMMDASK